MAAATFDRDTRQLGTGAPLNDVASYPVKAGEKGFGGTIGVHDAQGRAVKATATTGLTCVGRVEAPFDNTNGQDGDVKARILRGIFKWAQGNAGTKIGTSNAAIDLTPKTSGVTARIVVSGNNTALSVGVVGSAITINSATDNGGAATTTGAQALAAVLASADAMALLTAAALSSGSDGTGTVGAVGATSLRYEIITAVDATAYILDDQTVVATDGGSARSAAGKVHQIDADGVYIRAGV